MGDGDQPRRQVDEGEDDPLRLLRDRYLLLIAFFILVLNVVNTLGGFLLNTLIRQEALQRVAPGATSTAGLSASQIDAVQGLIGTMAGTVQTSVNILAFLIGAFLVSRILKYMGVRGAMFILPCIALGTYSLMAILPVLSIVRVGKQGPDHPVLPGFAEGSYLKTAFAIVR